MSHRMTNFEIGKHTKSLSNFSRLFDIYIRKYSTILNFSFKFIKENLHIRMKIKLLPEFSVISGN